MNSSPESPKEQQQQQFNQFIEADVLPHEFDIDKVVLIKKRNDLGCVVEEEQKEGGDNERCLQKEIECKLEELEKWNKLCIAVESKFDEVESAKERTTNVILKSRFVLNDKPRVQMENFKKDFSERMQGLACLLRSISTQRKLHLEEITKLTARISGKKLSYSEKLAKIRNLHKVIKSIKDNFHLKSSCIKDKLYLQSQQINLELNQIDCKAKILQKTNISLINRTHQLNEKLQQIVQEGQLLQTNFDTLKDQLIATNKALHDVLLTNAQ